MAYICCLKGNLVWEEMLELGLQGQGSSSNFGPEYFLAGDIIKVRALVNEVYECPYRIQYKWN